MYFKNFAAHPERLNGSLQRRFFGAIGLGGTALWPLYHHSVLAPLIDELAVAWRPYEQHPACRRVGALRASVASAFLKAIVSRTRPDRSSAGLMCGGEYGLTHAIRRRHARRLAS